MRYCATCKYANHFNTTRPVCVIQPPYNIAITKPSGDTYITYVCQRPDNITKIHLGYDKNAFDCESYEPMEGES